MSGISSLYLLDSSFSILLHRTYRSSLPSSVLSSFLSLLSTSSSLPPILLLPPFSFFYVTADYMMKEEEEGEEEEGGKREERAWRKKKEGGGGKKKSGGGEKKENGLLMIENEIAREGGGGGGRVWEREGESNQDKKYKGRGGIGGGGGGGKGGAERGGGGEEKGGRGGGDEGGGERGWGGGWEGDCLLCAIAEENVNATMIFSFLYAVRKVFAEFLRKVTTETIKDNVVLLNEVLDEVCDNGYPQFTEPGILKEYINTTANMWGGGEEEEGGGLRFAELISWRKEGIYYDEDEIYMEIIESLDMVINKNGGVVNSAINGAINCQCCLSGMPLCKIKLNKEAKHFIDDMKFHNCVDLRVFSKKGSIKFLPPDGEFELLSYRVQETIRPVYSVDFDEDLRRGGYEFKIAVKANYIEESIAEKFEIFIPVPCDVAQPMLSCIIGKAIFLPEKEAVKWEIPNFAGDQQFQLNASFKLPSVQSEDRENFRKKPIMIEFLIPYYTVSGIQVTEIVTREEYEANGWVRCETKSGRYEIRK